VSFQITDIPRILPELLLLLLALLVISSDILERWGTDQKALEERGRAAGQLAAIGLGLVLIVTLIQSRFLFVVPDPGTNPLLNVFINFGRNLQAVNSNATPLMGAYAIDGLTMIARILFASAALVVTLLAMNGKPLQNPGEFYALLLFATLGMCVMAGSVELILAFIALELSSIALYVLAGYVREDARSIEAGMKYFLFGAISSGILLYGMSLAYGFSASEANKTGANVITTLFGQIGQAGVITTAFSPVVLVSIIFIIAGLGYKIAAVPFHSWVPDVYEGAPPIVTTLIATASKTAGFLLLYRFMTIAFPSTAGHAGTQGFGGWAGMLAVIALLSIVFGNLAALPQKSVRRMLAYSAIGHTGFALVAMTLAGAERPDDQAFAVAALLVYLAAYLATSLVAFGVLAIVLENSGGDSIEDLRGLWKRNGSLAFLLSISLLSLAGIPPLAGFWAKLLVFMAAYRAGAIWVVAIALAMTVVALAYYLRVVRAIWSASATSEEPIQLGAGQSWTLGIATLLMLLIGLVPAPLWDIFQRVTQVAGR
jgi:NADH-quinone oxidoreductase subunit N